MISVRKCELPKPVGSAGCVVDYDLLDRGLRFGFGCSTLAAEVTARNVRRAAVRAEPGAGWRACGLSLPLPHAQRQR